MGIFACILFGVLAAFVVRAMFPASYCLASIALLIGVSGGSVGLSGILIGWGNLSSFNLPDVLLAMFTAATLMWFYQELRQRLLSGKAEE